MTRTQRLILMGLGTLCLGLVGMTAFLALRWSTSARVETITPQAAASAYPTEAGYTAPLPLATPTPSANPTSIPPSPSPLPPQTPVANISPARSAFPDLTCVKPMIGGLGSEIYAIVLAMPGPNSEGLRIPTEAQMAAWEELVHAVLQGEIPAACQIIHSQGFPYHLVYFTDVRNNRERYWMLREDAPVSTGWGTYVFRTAGNSQDLAEQFPLIIEVPHPVADWFTDPQAVTIFRQSRARALLVAGTHRCANSDFSTCTGQTWACGPLEAYRVSDAAHTTQSMFQATHRALSPCDGTTITLQLHANSLGSCPDLFISNGTLFPGARSQALYQAASSACEGYTVDIGDGVGLNGKDECVFTGGASAQAVYSNSCPTDPAVNACADPPPRPAGAEQYISLEQSGKLTDDYQCLVEAIQAVWGAAP
jgi:hypothetical protein